MDTEKYAELRKCFAHYLTEKGLRKTEERFAILECICNFPGHFDMWMLHRKMEEKNFHVSRTTVYNTIEVLVECGLVVRHQFPASSFQYELRTQAETHFHLICMQCGSVREVKNETLRRQIGAMRITRFKPAYRLLYIYGLCQTCNRLQTDNKNKNNNSEE